MLEGFGDVHLSIKLSKRHPVVFKKAICSLAQFQRWLHQAKTNAECKDKILLMIKERHQN